MLLSTSLGWLPPQLAAASFSGQLPDRSQTPVESRWKLEDLYPDQKTWDQDYQRVEKLSTDFAQYKGKLGSSPAVLLRALQHKDYLGQIIEKLYVYAKLKRDEDTANTASLALSDRADQLSVQTSAALSYLDPELLTLSADKLASFVRQEPELSHYDFYFRELRRQRQHILSPQEEQLIAQAGEVMQSPQQVYNISRNTDMKYLPTVDEDGQETPLSEGRYRKLIMSHNRDVRQKAAVAMSQTYDQFKYTYAATYAANVKKDMFYTKARNYPSTLAAALESDNVPVDVYTNLISSVSKLLPSYHRYLAVRKKLLGVNELHQYDLYAPLVPEFKWNIPYPEAQSIVLNALSPLGPDYLATVKKALAERWIDVYENKGKQTGAYSWGAYGVHPYMLLNYNDTVDDVFTLAHEMGHSMHSHLSDSNQPYIYAGYTIFAAEVASTTNEALLMNYMLNHTQNREQKLYLLNQYLEQVQGTLFRQAQFAEFELIVHQKAEHGESITVDVLNQVWHDLNVKYLGPDVVIDAYTDNGWARIPHFYNSYYVYKYVTGFSAGASLSQQILTEGQPARDRYLQFLKSGGSDYTLNILKNAGVDMSSPKPIEQAIRLFDQALSQFEQTMSQS